MRNIIHNKNFYLVLLLDFFLIVAAYFLAYLLRFEGQIPIKEWKSLTDTLPYIVPFKLSVFMFFGLYKGMWRYTSLVDLFNILKGTIISSGIVMIAILFIYRFEGFPRSVFVLDWILTSFFIAGVRVAIRLLLSERERGLKFLFQNPFSKRRTIRPQKRLLIIGAGDAGEKMLREIRDNPRLNYEVVGFLDDDPKKRGMRIHGVTVLGSVSRIHDMAYRDEMDEILIAVPSASAKQMRRIIEACEATGLKSRTTPGIGELIDGKISFKTVREVSFEDLLGRDPVNLDMKSIGNYLADKVVLVSGAGGSIGTELCRQIALFQPKNLILLDKTENSLFHIEMEFRQRFPNIFVTSVLGDVKYRSYLNKHFAYYRPQVVFHAAAYKHVPIVELNPWEAVFNNILGTKNIVEMSHKFGIERFIMISTDKAVRPSSVMGATKRVAEMITSCYASNPSRFVSVRFGNVIGSEGSVVHLFKKQIERFGPVTVTHPEITRYFMTVPESCKLILQAGALGEGGEIFILDMGTPIKILDMARDLIRRSGFKPDVDIEIKFIGLRPGEKLHEELITEGEGIVRTPYDKIFVLKGDTFDLNWLYGKIEELVKLANEQDAEGIKSKLKEILPEYQPFDLNHSKSSPNQ
ncbi:MAG: polysaccharide biosynthesis protein [Deltaproteobacteria bacterium CG_4_8_14_3_um_filter_45_9]|nr:MAG: polysaccharide biosynthesis protein [Deltaproteobacteria bacterium CG03_land_8_20_14_0_80_45_14]PIX21634.1 MAG: polysaccharide biosynthesis protein [Deltaproteobacteria bacterium CG_4_8_14_3_um_filter_45_9]